MSARPPTPTQTDQTSHAHAPIPYAEYALANGLLPSTGPLAFHSRPLNAKPSSTVPPPVPMQPTYIPHSPQARLRGQNAPPRTHPFTRPWQHSWDSSDDGQPGAHYVIKSVNQQPRASSSSSSSSSEPLPSDLYQNPMAASDPLRPSAFHPSVLEPTPDDQQPQFDPFTRRRRIAHGAVSSPVDSPGGLGPRSVPQDGSRVSSQHTGDRTSRYMLTVRQQPIAARACGMGERDRRVVDPPPIVQLSLTDFDPRSAGDVDALRNPHISVHCALLDIAGTDVTQAKDSREPARMIRGLTGGIMASPFVGTDPAVPPSGVDNARLGCFFIFPDISVRQPGRYRLEFKLVKHIVECLPTGSQTPNSILGVIESDIFEVFTAKDFPGMKASTPLMKELKRQGASGQVKKGSEAKKAMVKGHGQKRGSDVSGEDAYEGSQNASSRRRRR
ncbi:MAG: hypothetical protein LQ338_001170 [Usnochroma carphineum]|nr:MAG: hypothetical protein LQ338_001170 [Usnochroma carphineum]